MDELQIVKYPLSLAEIQGEISRAPMINLHLDEDSINGRYDDETENGPNGTGFITSCSGDACPQPGTKGQIREAATFDGSDFLTVEGTESQLTDFTLSMWVKPSHQIGDRQYLMTKADGNQYVANFRLYLESNSMTLGFDKQFGCANFDTQFTGVTASGSPLLGRPVEPRCGHP